MSEEPRGRGRPQGSGIIDRSDIVGAALDALAAGGYPALSMRGVARALDVSLGAVQHHFTTKDALWKAAMDEFSSSLQRYWLTAVNPDLTGVIDDLLAQGTARPGLMAAILSDRTPGSMERFSYIAGRVTEQMERSQATIANLAADGQLRQIDARALLMIVGIGVSSIAGAAEAMQTVFGYNLQDATERHALAGALTDILTLGVLPR